MRRHLLLLIAAALLLRGWVGEAMAGQMLALQLQAAGAPVEVVAVHGPDCPGRAAANDEASGDADAAVNVLHCQDCTLNALPAPALALSQPLPAPAAATPQPAFTSAEPQPGAEPPIS